MAYTDIVGADLYLGASDLIGAEDVTGAEDIIGNDPFFGANPYTGVDPDIAALVSGAEVAIGADPELAALMAGAAALPPAPAPPPPPPAMPGRLPGGQPLMTAQQWQQVQLLQQQRVNQLRQARRQDFLRGLAARNSVALVDRTPSKSREFPLGFPETILAPNETRSISQRPQIPFRGKRLFIPSDIAGSLIINDIRIGKNSQLVASGPLPGRAFSEVGVDTALHFDTAQVSQDIVLNITNISGAQIRFFAALFGHGVE